MSVPRKHHLVAQTYQRAFARRSGKVWQGYVLDRSTGEGGLRNVRDIFAQRDWNTIVDADGTKLFDIEQLIAESIDEPAAAALDAVRADRFPLSDEEASALATFMSAQLTRGRVIRENLMDFVSEVTTSVLRLAAAHYSDEQWLERTGEVPSAEARRRIGTSKKGELIRPTNAQLLNTLLSNVEDVAELLFTRTWTFVRFDAPCLFTAENPVVHINPSGQSMGYGVATAERMYMPISPTRALVLSQPWTPWPDDLVDGTPELARRLNWAMLSYPSNRELLLHPDVVAHALPGPGTLAGGEAWPWGPDPESKPPLFMEYVTGPCARVAAGV
jgi:hypothetical protein